MQSTNPFDQFDPAPASSHQPGVIYGAPKAPDPLQAAQLGLAQNREARDASMQPLEIEAKRTTIANARSQEADTQFNQRGSLRKEYNSLAPVQAYEASLPAYGTVLNATPTKAGDLQLISSFAKLSDPGSSVMQGESESVAEAQGAARAALARAQAMFTEKGQLDDKMRADLRNAAKTKMAALNGVYLATRVRYKEQAQRDGFDPIDVVGEHLGGRYNDDVERAFGKPEAKADFYGEPIAAPIEQQAAQGSQGGGTPFDLSQITENGDVPPEIANTNDYIVAYVRKFGKAPPLQVNVTGGQRGPGPVADDTIGHALSLGTGGVVEGLTNATLGLVANPLNTGVNAVLGTNLSTNLGATLRDTLGFDRPRNDSERTVEAINQGGAGALGIAGLARAAPGVLNGFLGSTGAARTSPVVSALGAAPGVDIAAGAVAGAASETARQNGYGTAAQLGFGVLGGAGVATGNALVQGVRSLAGPRTPNALLAASDRQKIELMAQDVGGQNIGRMTQGTAQTTFGTKTLADKASQVYDSFKNRVAEVSGNNGRREVEVGDTIRTRAEQLAQRSSARADETSAAVMNEVGTAAADNTAAGQAGARGLTQWMRDTAARASQLYERVPIPQDREASVGATRQALAQMTSEMESNPQLSAMFQNPRLRAYLDALTPETTDAATGVLDAAGRPITRSVTEGGQLSWQDLMEFRTRVGDMLDEPRLSEKIAPRQLRTLYGSLSRDMEATARAEGPQAFRGWRRANDFYDGRQKRIDNTLSLVVGQRSEKTPDQFVNSLEQMLREGPMGNAAAFSQVMRSLPANDASALRATIVRNQRGGFDFNAPAFAKNWGTLSERGKSALLPQRGAREFMEDAANRATASDRNPFAGKGGEQVFLSFEKMANNKGDSTVFRRQINSMSPEEANAVRGLVTHRLGMADAGAQTAEGDAFSVAKFLTRWSDMSDEAKMTLYGTGTMRQDMDDLARLSERVKSSEKLAGHSNTGAINNWNATTGGLGGAGILAASGHPFLAVAAAMPAVMQKITAEMLTSRRLVRWLASAPANPSPAYIQRLKVVAAREPALKADLSAFQRALSAANDNVGGMGRSVASPGRERDQDGDNRQPR